MEVCIQKARVASHVVTCDISEFYPRLNHHRLDNALRQLHLPGDQPSKIMAFLDNFSQTYSFGIPVGGPAARILSELLLNQIDQLLRAEGIEFCRLSDDYHFFASSYQDAFKAVLFLSERLINNQGLQLQKSKTRIMSSAEFLTTNPLRDPRALDDTDDMRTRTMEQQSRNLLGLSIRFDPYSPTAADDYEALKDELSRIDIIGLLKSELSKNTYSCSIIQEGRGFDALHR
jgi:hypothetical protein